MGIELPFPKKIVIYEEVLNDGSTILVADANEFEQGLMTHCPKEQGLLGLLAMMYDAAELLIEVKEEEFDDHTHSNHLNLVRILQGQIAQLQAQIDDLEEKLKT